MKDPLINCSYNEIRDIVNLTAHPKNPNTHNDEQIRLLSEIIRHQGWRNPIVVSSRSGFIVAGHGRLLAAEMLGLKKVPVDLQDFKTEADELSHLIADNRIAELSEINRGTLADLIGELDNGDFDLNLTGFDSFAVEELMTAAPPEDLDDFFVEDTSEPKEEANQITLQYTKEEFTTISDKLNSMHGSKEKIIYEKIVNSK